MNTTQRIQNLVFGYAELVDEGDFDALGSLFTRGSLTFSPSGLTLHGAREVASFYRRSIRIDPDTGTPRTIHRVSNLIVVPGGDEWHARSRYDVSLHSDGNAPQLIATGRYFDTFRVAGDDVYFHQRKLVSEYLGDTQGHLTEGFAETAESGQPHHGRSLAR